MFYFTVSVFYKGNVEKKKPSVAFGFVKSTEKVRNIYENLTRIVSYDVALFARKYVMTFYW